MNGPAKKSELLPKKEGPRWLRQLRKVYKSNTFLIVFSVLCAVMLWSVLVAADGTLTREKVFTDVEVTMSGMDTLKSNGYIVIDDDQSVLPTVRLTVEVTQNNYSRATASNFSPRVDVSKIRATGEQTVEITFGSSVYGKVVSCEPSSVTVNVERYVSSNRIPVVIDTEGTLAEGLWMGSPSLDPAYIAVSGPRSVVNSIKRAVAKFDLALLNGESVTQRSAVPFVLEDAQGEAVNSSQLRTTYQSILIDTVTVEADVYPQKALPIDVTGAYIGEPAEGYEVTDVTVQPETVLVAAQADVLEQLSAVVLDAPIDITGATEPQSVTVRIKKLSDAQNMSIGEALVQIDIAQKQRERTFKNVPITVTGVQETQKVKLSSKSAHVTLTGPYHFINELTADDILLSVDLSGLEAGEHLVGLTCHVANAPEYTCVLSIDQVTAIIDEP